MHELHLTIAWLIFSIWSFSLEVAAEAAVIFIIKLQDFPKWRLSQALDS
jgi:hypothetical protein